MRRTSLLGLLWPLVACSTRTTADSADSGAVRTTASAADSAGAHAAPDTVGHPVGWDFPASDPSYAFGVDTQVTHSGRASGYLEYTGPAAGGGAKLPPTDSLGTGLSQAIHAEAYRGKRVQLSGYLRTRDAATGTLWMRVDGLRGGRPVSFGLDNMMLDSAATKRGATGTTDWRRYGVVLDVPEAAEQIIIGALFSGRGRMWMDDFRLEAVEGTVPSTNMLKEPDLWRVSAEEAAKVQSGWARLSRAPVNLDFEAGTAGNTRRR